MEYIDIFSQPTLTMLYVQGYCLMIFFFFKCFFLSVTNPGQREVTLVSLKNFQIMPVTSPTYPLVSPQYH